MRFIFKNINEYERVMYPGKYLGRPNLEFANFPYFYKSFNNSGVGEKVLCPGYAEPIRMLECAIVWCWLRYQIDEDVDVIEELLSNVVSIGLALHETSVVEYRERFDLLLMYCASLSGNDELLARAADSSWHCGSKEVPPSVHPFYPSLSGILKYSVLEDVARMNEQMEFCSKSGRLPWIALPSAALLTNFVNRDIQKFDRQLDKEIHKFELTLSIKKKSNNIEPSSGRDGQDVVIDMAFRVGVKYWLYPEAVLARLLARAGKRTNAKSVWLPSKLINYKGDI